jgi:hypothetical protein
MKGIPSFQFLLLVSSFDSDLSDGRPMGVNICSEFLFEKANLV